MMFWRATEGLPGLTEQQLKDVLENPVFHQWFNRVCSRIYKEQKRAQQQNEANRDYYAGFAAGLEEALVYFKTMPSDLDAQDSDKGGRGASKAYVKAKLEEWFHE